MIHSSILADPLNRGIVPYPEGGMGRWQGRCTRAGMLIALMVTSTRARGQDPVPLAVTPERAAALSDFLAAQIVANPGLRDRQVPAKIKPKDLRSLAIDAGGAALTHGELLGVLEGSEYQRRVTVHTWADPGQCGPTSTAEHVSRGTTVQFTTNEDIPRLAQAHYTFICRCVAGTAEPEALTERVYDGLTVRFSCPDAP